MARPEITAQDIADHQAWLAQMQSLAATVGLNFDEGDRQLASALETIAARRLHSPLRDQTSSATSATGGGRSQTAIALETIKRMDAQQDQRRGLARQIADQTDDELAMRVVAIMRARRGLPPLAAKRGQ